MFVLFDDFNMCMYVYAKSSSPHHVAVEVASEATVAWLVVDGFACCSRHTGHGMGWEPQHSGSIRCAIASSVDDVNITYTKDALEAHGVLILIVCFT